MIDSRKHLPGSLSEPGFEAPSLGSANTQLSSRPTLWRQRLDSITEIDSTDWAEGISSAAKSMSSASLQISHLCLNFLFELTLRIWEHDGWQTVREGVFALEGRILPHSDSSSWISIVEKRFRHYIASLCAFLQTYTQLKNINK